MKDTSLPEKDIEKLKLVLKAKEFAVTNLHLNPGSGYEYFVKLDRNAVGWNVSGTKELEFRSYTWWFPIVGSVPYLGFFDEGLAKEEELALQKKGYETRIRITGGYSTLGYFSDPIFSPQLQNGDWNLVGLVFHEMAHATVYLNGESIFNESYAEFIEEKGIELFFGKEGREWKEFQSSKIRNQKVKKIMLEYSNILKKLYESSKTDSEKREEKKSILEKFKIDLANLFSENPAFQKKILEKQWNNEDFVGYLRYSSLETFFQSEFEKAKGEFEKFHKLVPTTWKELSKEERNRLLNQN